MGRNYEHGLNFTLKIFCFICLSLEIHDVLQGPFTIYDVNLYDPRILSHVLFHGGSELTLGLMTYILFDAPWHKEQENILSKGEDLNQFQVIWSFFVSWGVTTTFQAQVLHTNSCRKKQEYIYDLGVGISTVFKIFGHSLFYRSQDSSWAHTCNLHVHTMWCPFTQNMVKR